MILRNRMFGMGIIGSLLVLSFAISCSDDATSNSGRNTQSVKRGLLVIGQTQVNTVPNTSQKFTVLYFETDDKATKGLPGENLALKFVKDAKDSQLVKNVVATDVNGRADVEVRIGNNFRTDAPTTIQIEVAPQTVDPKYSVEPIYLSIIVRPVGSSLKAVGPTERQGCVGQKVTLQVKMTQIDYTSKQTRELPIQGRQITFTIVRASGEVISAKFDPSGGDTVQADTNLSGIASATLYAGDEARDYHILAQAEGVPSVQFHLVVNSKESCVAGCKTSKDCGDGLICVNGECKSKDEPIACQKTEDCPRGYECLNNVCESTTTCPPGYHLDPGGPGQSPSCVADNPEIKPCKTDADCPGPNYYCQNGECKEIKTSCDSISDCPYGYICENHTCVPGGGGDCTKDSDCPTGFCKDGKCISCIRDSDCPQDNICADGICVPKPKCGDMEDVDVTGLWYTEHNFDLSNALLGLPKLAEPLDFIDQVFKGNLGDIGNIPIIGDILKGLVQDLIKQYVPPWVPNLIHGLNALANILQQMQVEGVMELWDTQVPDMVNGKEQWESIVVWWIDQCPKGRQDPNWPQCAELDIAMGDADIKMTENRPIVGIVDCDTLFIRERVVEFEAYKLINYLVNLITQITTGYDTLEDAVENMIDCAEVQQAVDDMACDMSDGRICSVPGIEAACEAAKKQLPKALMDWLAKQGLPTKMTFSGSAKIVDDDKDKYADHLKDGVWNGKIEVLFNGKLTGTWKAER